MRRIVRRIAKVVLIAAPVAYFFPKIFLIYAICGIYDVWRNDERTAELIGRYFLGNGVVAWLLSPLNVLLDLLSLPYVNKGVYRLSDLPEEHQREISRLIDAAYTRNLVPQLAEAAAGGKRSMFFFKWYGTNFETVASVPEFHDGFRYITTIGVSVFNRKQSTSKHFGPLRATLRVLYNLNDVIDDFGLYRRRQDQTVLARREALHLRRHAATPVVQRIRPGALQPLRGYRPPDPLAGSVQDLRACDRRIHVEGREQVFLLSLERAQDPAGHVRRASPPAAFVAARRRGG